jgi:hypothetical protein
LSDCLGHLHETILQRAINEIRTLLRDERVTHLFHKQPFASILQTLPSFLDPSPTFQHIRNLPFQQFNPLQNAVAHLYMAGYRLQVSVKVRFLAPGDDLVD